MPPVASAPPRALAVPDPRHRVAGTIVRFPVSNFFRLPHGRSCPRVRRSSRTGRHNVRPVLQPLEDRAVPAAYVVVNPSDAGVGSLRQAILDTNANPGADTITFDPVA